MNSSAEFIGQINNSNPQKFTMLALADQLLNITDSKSKLANRPPSLDDPKQRQPNVSLAK